MSATPASMLHIISRGLQDIERLNPPRGQPSVGFYTAVIRQRTRWASQWRRVEFDNLADFGRKATVTLPILGELITRATLVVELPDLYTPQRNAEKAALSYGIGGLNCLIGPHWSWTNGIGHALCSNVEFSIGGTVIDRLDSRLLEVLDEQTGEVEHWDSKNAMIARDPSDYTQFDYRGIKPTQQRPQTLEIVCPFWWNRGPGPQALPIQALAKDKVQITVDFRSIQECVYTDARVNPANPGAEASQAGPMPIMAGCGFYQVWPEADGGVPIYDMTRTGISCGFGVSKTPIGRVLPGVTMPAANKWHFTDAYWIVEYVSLEDREAAAYRMADLQIPIEQHVAVPVTQTAGSRQLRVPLAQGGLVREMTWVAQRMEATDYNAYFLFSRDLAAPGATPSEIPWWPDARVPDWNYGDGYLRPGFADRRSDPITAATLWYRGTRRFEHEGPSFFRSLLPALACRRTPLIDRYIYRYDFGFWPTGGLVETLDMERDEIRGFANWDKIPNKELALTMNLDDCDKVSWETDISQQPISPSEFTDSQVLYRVFDYVSRETAAIQVELRGAANGGRGAIVRGVIDLQALQRTFGYNCMIWLRFSVAGAVGILVEQPGAPSKYTWIAVAGSGGSGSGIGGRAATAVAIGFRGDGIQTHEASAPAIPEYGGAGGGRLAAAGVGLPDGAAAATNPTAAWVSAGTSVGGVSLIMEGGDGYTGGGSGTVGGGGGGSYVSRYITQVESIEVPVGSPTTAGATIVPLVRKLQPAPAFNIYVWLTTYNMLRITNGRGALMFSA
jgi:hypothetical protein